MEDIRYTKQLLDYQPIGRLIRGRSLKKLLDRYNREGQKQVVYLHNFMS